MGAVANLACIRSHQAVIVEAGAAPLLLALMAPSAPAGCQEAAARGFGNLVRPGAWAGRCGGCCACLARCGAAMPCYAFPASLRPCPRPLAPLPPHPAQVCDALADGLRSAAYQAVPLLVGITRASGSPGAKQAAARALSNLVCSDATAQVRAAAGEGVCGGAATCCAR